MEYILFPDPVEVARPSHPISAKNTKTISPLFREDDHSPTGYSFWFPEPFWGLRKKLPPDATWDDVSGRYVRRYKNGRVVDWFDDRATENTHQKRIEMKLNGVQFDLDWDVIDMICSACPDAEITTVDGKEYWPLAEPDLMKVVTEHGCQCAEFIFMRTQGNDKMSRNCRHMKLLMTGNNHLACDICCASEHDTKVSPDLEIFQFCETTNCNNMVCGSCHETIMRKSAVCPFCREDL